MHYGRKLRELIKWRGMAVKTVSERTGTPLATLKRQFASEFPDLQICLAVLNFLQIDHAVMFGGLTSMESQVISAIRTLPDARRDAVVKALIAIVKA